MTIWVYTGGRPSNGAKTLSDLKGFKRCLQGKGLKRADILINWGNSKAFDIPVPCDIVLNRPQFVCRATNKLEAFAVMAGQVPTVDFAIERDKAQEWADNGGTVVVRKILNGHSGAGIEIVEPGGDVPDAPLYTKYIFKVREYRVHVCKGVVIDVQQKIRDPAREPDNWKVRSHHNGFIFARNNVGDNDRRDEAAIGAIKTLGLDFGAVDIVEDKLGRSYVLEVNTAPGLEGKTIQSYGDTFSAYQG